MESTIDKTQHSRKWFWIVLSIVGILFLGIAYICINAVTNRCILTDKSQCAHGHLARLYMGMRFYVEKLGTGKNYPPHVGQQFWLCLSQNCIEKDRHPATYYSQVHVFGRTEKDLYECPAAHSSEDSINYLGPKKHTPDGNPSALVEGLPPDTPIAADKKGNHKDGGNVLFFDGRVQFLTGEEYEKALKELE
jgi:prepilin-type processing-associated H-X9-DG protein